MMPPTTWTNIVSAALRGCRFTVAFPVASSSVTAAEKRKQARARKQISDETKDIRSRLAPGRRGLVAFQLWKCSAKNFAYRFYDF
jgi:hypothetical protein